MHACENILGVYGLEDPYHKWKTTPSRRATSHFFKYQTAQSCQKIEPPPLFLGCIFTHHNFAVKLRVVLVIGISEEIPALLHHPYKPSTAQSRLLACGVASSAGPEHWEFSFLRLCQSAMEKPPVSSFGGRSYKSNTGLENAFCTHICVSASWTIQTCSVCVSWDTERLLELSFPYCHPSELISYPHCHWQYILSSVPSRS